MSPSPTQAEAASPTDVSGAQASLIEDRLRVTLPARRRIRLADVWASLPVGWMLGRRDVKIKYKQSALGPLWLVLQPLGMLAALTLAFSKVTNVDTGDVPYVVFALVGLAVWTYVQMTITVAPQVLPSNWQVVRRSPCPRVAFVTGTLISVLPPLAVVLAASVAAAAISGSLGIEALAMPVLLVWLVLLMWGFTLLVTALGGRFRDAVALAPVVVQAGIFLTPVGYPLDAAGSFAKVLAFNPASGVIEGWRWSLLGIAPDGFAIAVAVAETAVVTLLGWYVFGRMETRFSDYV
ncbi:MAG TPA: ABC transporter permease [Solirubrobacterales bacterium]